MGEARNPQEAIRAKVAARRKQLEDFISDKLCVEAQSVITNLLRRTVTLDMGPIEVEISAANFSDAEISIVMSEEGYRQALREMLSQVSGWPSENIAIYDRAGKVVGADFQF